MFGIRTRLLATAVVATLSSPVALMAQWGAALSDCGCYAPAPAPVVTTSCQCLQPVTQMVARQMQVTEYRQAQKVEKRAVQKVRMVSKPATAYRQVMEARTVEVPAMTYQTVTEMVPKTINKSRWQTISQPIPKMAACQYDSRPGMMGKMNRLGYQARTAFQPNFVTHRQFIPQVCQCNVPVQRQVAVPTTRKVTYNTAKTVPYETTHQVAEYYTDYEDVTVTAMEPVTVTKTVHVPVTRMAVVDPYTGMAIAPQGTQTAREPTPVRSAENKDAPPAGALHKGISYPKQMEAAPANDHNVIRHDAPVSHRAAATVVSTGTDGWKAHKPASPESTTPKTLGGKSSVVSK